MLDSIVAMSRRRHQSVLKKDQAVPENRKSTEPRFLALSASIVQPAGDRIGPRAGPARTKSDCQSLLRWSSNSYESLGWGPYRNTAYRSSPGLQDRS